MGVFDELAKILAPHSHRLNENIATQGALLHGHLSGIQNALDDLGRPDFGDKWRRIPLRGELGAEEIELDTVPMNEVWAVQAIAIYGVAAKTPAFAITSAGQLVYAYTAEKTEYVNVGGNIVFLPGEKIAITPAAEGAFVGSISIIRRPIPDIVKRAQTGHSSEVSAPVNTHDPQRDVLESRTGQYRELPREVENSAGRSPAAISPPDGVVDPTSV